MDPPFRLESLQGRAEISCRVKGCFPHKDPGRAPDLSPCLSRRKYSCCSYRRALLKWWRRSQLCFYFCDWIIINREGGDMYFSPVYECSSYTLSLYMDLCYACHCGIVQTSQTIWSAEKELSAEHFHLAYTFPRNAKAYGGMVENQGLGLQHRTPGSARVLRVHLLPSHTLVNTRK